MAKAAQDYRYQAWITNLRLPSPEVWRLYRQRADSENRIEELKHDFGLNGFCAKDFYAAEAAFTDDKISMLCNRKLDWKKIPLKNEGRGLKDCLLKLMISRGLLRLKLNSIAKSGRAFKLLMQN